jgi:hypothetical protein
MGRGQGGFAGASPQWAAVTDAKQRPGKQSAKPTQLAPVPRHEAKGFVAFGLDLRNPEG